MFDKQILEQQIKTANGRSDPLARWRAALLAGTVLMSAGFALSGAAVAAEINDRAGRATRITRR